MSDDQQTPSEEPDNRGAVVRLAEALAAAQRVAREVDTPAADGTRPADEPVAGGDGATDTGAAATATEVVGAAGEPVADRVRVVDATGPDVVAEAGRKVRADTAGDPHDVGTAAAGGDGTPEPDGDGATDTGSRARRRLWPLHVIMAILVLAVPVLGYVGYRLTSDSTTGEVLSGRADPDSPGYLALVEPTPVALIMRTTDDGVAEDLTILSLSGPDQDGGVVITAPVEMELDDPHYGIERFSQTIEINRPETAARFIGQTLGLGFTEALRLTDSELVRSVESVEPLRIENPEAVTTTDGVVFDSGPLELSAEQVPAYLSATDAGDTTSGALTRQGLVWSAWVTAIADTDDPGAVPGEKTVGLGRFLGGLAEGEVQTATFPVVPVETDPDGSDPDGSDVPVTYEVDRGPADLLIANAVPFPVGARDGDRSAVALMNGTGPDPTPASVIQRLTYAGAQITTTGNARSFDHAETVLTYSGSEHRAAAERMATELGVGRVEAAENPDSGVDIRIVMGADLLDDPPDPLTAQDVTTP